MIKQDRGIFDTFPLSLITTQTIGRLGEMVGATLDVQRFRPNILVEAADEAPFPEDGWVGCVLRIGGMRMRVDKRDGRCVIITIDPVTTERNPAILRTVAARSAGLPRRLRLDRGTRPRRDERSRADRVLTVTEGRKRGAGEPAPHDGRLEAGRLHRSGSPEKSRDQDSGARGAGAERSQIDCLLRAVLAAALDAEAVGPGDERPDEVEVSEAA